MALPSFLVIGVAKAGTTSLNRYLRQHPEVFVPAQKELNFFWTEAAEHGRLTPVDLAAYERCFDDAGSALAVGEVSPRYFQSPGAPDRIRSTLPDARLVVVLRDPADRAWSDHLGRLRTHRTTDTFSAATAPGEECFEWGLYSNKLVAYLDRFPAEQLLVLLYDDLVASPQLTMRTIFEHIGVDTSVEIDMATRHNRAALPRNHAVHRLLWRSVTAASALVPPNRRASGRGARLMARAESDAPAMDVVIRRALVERYRADIEATGRLLGIDLSHWLDDLR